MTLESRTVAWATRAGRRVGITAPTTHGARATGALELEIHTALEQITASAVRALARARRQHDAGQDAVKADLARLEQLRDGVEQMRVPVMPHV